MYKSLLLCLLVTVTSALAQPIFVPPRPGGGGGSGTATNLDGHATNQVIDLIATYSSSPTGGVALTAFNQTRIDTNANKVSIRSGAALTNLQIQGLVPYVNDAPFGSLNMRKLPYTRRQLDSNGAPWTIAMMGDSMAHEKMNEAYPWLYNAHGSNGFAFGFGAIWNWNTNGAITNIVTFGQPKGTNWFVDYYDLGLNATMTWTNQKNTAGITANRFEVYFLRGPQAGAFKIQTMTNGGAFADALTVDAYTASSWRGAVTNISVVTGDWQFRIVGLSNTPPSILGAGAYVTNSTGVRFVSLGRSSISPPDILQVPTNHTWPIFQQLRVNTLLYEEKSEVATHETNIGLMHAWFTNAFPRSDIIIVGTTPDVTGAYAAANAFDRLYCLTNGLTYFDGANPVGTYNQMTNTFGADDGTHPTDACQSFLAGILIDEMGMKPHKPGTNSVIADLAAANRWTGQYNNFAGLLESSGPNGSFNMIDRTLGGIADPAERSLFYRSARTTALYDNVAGMLFTVNPTFPAAFNPGYHGMSLGTNNYPWILHGSNSFFYSDTYFKGGLFTTGTTARLVLGDVFTGGAVSELAVLSRTNSNLVYYDNTAGEMWRMETAFPAAFVPGYVGETLGSATKPWSILASNIAASGNISVTTTTPASGSLGLFATNNNAIYLKAASSNAVNITNMLGIVQAAYASVLVCDANVANNWTITNRITGTSTLLFTNTAAGQTMNATILGEASGGSSRVITVQPEKGQLAANLDDYSVALALSFSFTLTNGNAAEISDEIRQLNGTNVHKIVTRQFKF